MRNAKNVFKYRSLLGVTHEFYVRAPRLAAQRAVNKFKLPDDQPVLVTTIKGKEYEYMPWSRPIENPSEYQINTNLLIQRGVKRIKKNPGAPLEHPPNPLQDPPAGPKTTDHSEINI